MRKISINDNLCSNNYLPSIIYIINKKEAIVFKVTLTLLFLFLYFYHLDN